MTSFLDTCKQQFGAGSYSTHNTFGNISHLKLLLELQKKLIHSI